MMTAEERRIDFYGENDARAYDHDELYMMKEYAKDYHETEVKKLNKFDVSGQFSLAIVKKAFETFHYVGFPHNHPTWEEWAKENLR